MQFVARLTTPPNISKNTSMMHTSVSAPQRLPPHPLLNNFYLMYGSKYIVSVLRLQIKNSKIYVVICIFLFFSLRVASRSPTSDSKCCSLCNQFSWSQNYLCIQKFEKSIRNHVTQIRVNLNSLVSAQTKNFWKSLL